MAQASALEEKNAIFAQKPLTRDYFHMSESESSIIEYRGVELHRHEHVVLKDVDFSIAPGEFVYLVGKVGSGKTSLLKSLYAEVPVFAGQARIFDYDLCNIRKRDIPTLRRKVGIVFQDFQLLTDRTVYANLEFVLDATGWKARDAKEERIDKVLRQVGMVTKAYKMPHELSGGEQQRIVIARALLNEPQLIVADEPTGNLDPETGEQIMGHLYGIARSGAAAVIVATHNLNMLDRFPARAVMCENKHLVERKE